MRRETRRWRRGGNHEMGRLGTVEWAREVSCSPTPVNLHRINTLSPRLVKTSTHYPTWRPRRIPASLGPSFPTPVVRDE
jgi:hypothetical protein